MTMNWPNRLTLLRVLMIPVFLVVLLGGFWDDKTARLAAACLFVLASLTDWLDGYIARKQSLITTFGKFADPLADKLLVCAALVAMVEMACIPTWVVIVIISREFIVTGLRLVAVERNVVIAAGFSGKLKTAVSMVMIAWVLACGLYSWAFIPSQILIYASAVLTVYSAVEYIVQNKHVLKDVK